MDTKLARECMKPIDKRVNVELADEIARYGRLIDKARGKFAIEQIDTLLSFDASAMKGVREGYENLLAQLLIVVEREEAGQGLG